MRIWAFPSFYPVDLPGRRWAGIFAHRQYKGLISNGADLKVIVPVLWHPPFPFSELHPEWKSLQQDSYPEERTYDGIKVYHPRIANMRPNRFVKMSFRERYINAIVKFFKSQGIVPNPSTDIFYSQWLPDSVLVQEAAHKLGLKSAILSIGDDVVVWPHASSKNLVAFRTLMEEADMRFACAAYLGNETNKILGRDFPFDVVRWGVDYTHFKPVSPVQKAELQRKYKLPQGKVIILNVGTAIVRKGWIDLFDALGKVKENSSNFVLVAIHAGKPEIDLDAEAQRRGLADNFINLGEIHPDKANEIFNAVDIFCLPSHWEGLANANIEAMASGLPVITTNVCGHPELISNDENGILVNPHDAEVLSQKLLALIINEGLRTTLGENARRFIVEEWGDFAYNAAKLYSKLRGS